MDIAGIQPWAGLGIVLWLTLPLVVFAIGSAILLHLAFVVLPPYLPKALTMDGAAEARSVDRARRR